MGMFCFQKMFACKTKFHRHRRKLVCQVAKAAAMFVIVTMVASHTVLIKEAATMDSVHNQSSKQTKGETSF